MSPTLTPKGLQVLSLSTERKLVLSNLHKLKSIGAPHPLQPHRAFMSSPYSNEIGTLSSVFQLQTSTNFFKGLSVEFFLLFSLTTTTKENIHCSTSHKVCFQQVKSSAYSSHSIFTLTDIDTGNKLNMHHVIYPPPPFYFFFFLTPFFHVCSVNMLTSK